MRRLLVVALAALALAGCLGGAPTDTGNATPDTGNATSGARTVEGSAKISHVHDKWNGRDPFDVLDRDVEVVAAKANLSEGAILAQVGPRTCDEDQSTFVISFEAYCLGRAEFQPPRSQDPDRPKIFPPGTAQIDMTVSWEEPTIQGIRLEAIAANGEPIGEGSPGFADDGPATFTESGQTVTYTPEDVTHEDEAPPFFPLEWTDDGHALKSKWKFVAKAYGDTGSLAVADGTIHVTVTVHRTDGELPVEPPHPDWYGSTTGYHVGYAEETVRNTYQAHRYSLHDATAFLPVPANPVPPGTRELVARVDVTEDSFAADQTGRQVQLGYTPYGAWWSNDPGITWIDPAEQNGSSYLFRLPLKDWMTDSIYSCSSYDSTWSLAARVRQADAVEEDPVTGTDHPGAGHFAGRIQMSVAATERVDAAWSDLARDAPADVEGCRQVNLFYD